MRSLFLKEISGFFSSATGYAVVVVFLIVNGALLWWFPSEKLAFLGIDNILNAGYATLESLFIISPWLFIFLIPAITMRSFAEEKRSGNLDLLFTRPLTDMQIVLAKYFACTVVAAISILPTFFFFFSVKKLGSSPISIDMGATWGSYIGLVLLASVYVSVGLFASAITDNSILSFILAVVICLFLYKGFNSVGYLSLKGVTGNIIANLGIDAHYKSISRGVIDTRDLVYFFSVIFLFLYLTRTKLNSRKW